MKMNLKETSMDKTNPAQDRTKWQATVTTVMNL